MRLLATLLCVLLSPTMDAVARRRPGGELLPTAAASHPDPEERFSGPGRTDAPRGQQQQQQQQQQHSNRDLLLRSLGGPSCTLKVQVSDSLSRQAVNQARVEVYVDYTQATAGLTGADGVVQLPVPYRERVPNVVVVASKDGYLLTVSPWKPHRMPNVLFQPSVDFPQSLLNLSSISSNVSSLSAYFTAPVLQSGERDSPLSINAITAITSGYSCVELRAVAAVSVQLFSRGVELQVRGGPLHMFLPLEPGWGLQSGDHVPAWFFNHTAGGWMRGGLGTVMSSRGKLTWTFMAPRLGYWVAAPLPSTRGSKDLSVAIDFLVQHCLYIMAALGSTLLAVLLLLAAVCCCSQTKPKVAGVSHLRLSKRDQSTSTHEGHGALDVSVGGALWDEEGRFNLSAAGKSSSTHPRHDSPLCQENALALEMDLFFYNQPVAIVHVPAFFHMDQERPEERCGSAASDTCPVASETTRPQNAVPSLGNRTLTAANADGGRGSSGDPQTAPTAAAASTSQEHHHLPESLSVPGTLDKVRDKRHSCSGSFPGPGLQGEAGGPSPLPSRAWFVSLEGKPVAGLRHTDSDQHRRQRRPVESRDTSLDSGVDMSELNQTAGRRAGGMPLERGVTFVKRGQQQ
ncbi:hypothetical protein CRUP_009799 [Coryphaenoides rupestris]|nr:hypothetical protein CRUP_009799 [Coryphaenoides rupestris]